MRPSEDPQQKIVMNTNEARQATNRPRNMPTVLAFSTIGAFVACLVVYLLFFGG